MIKNLSAAACLSLIAVGCAELDKPAYVLPYAPDVRDRHEIVLRNELTTLDIYPTKAAGLDIRQQVDIQDFARAYLPSGKSRLVVSSPYLSRTADNGAVDRFATTVVSTLVKAGVPRSSIEMKRYQSLQPDRIEPIKLAYVQMEAGLTHQCGVWDDDLGALGAVNNLENLTHRNFGCAYQQNLAAQMANPLDAVRPTREAAPDSTQRVLMLRKYVAGEQTGQSRPEAKAGGGDYGTSKE